MSSKKKRLGSRRRAPNQNETFNTDVTDSTSVAQCHIPEETESLNETANSHKAQRETQRSPSPDPLGNTRKLGSSQRHRVKNVQESVTDSHQNSESTEEVEHSSRGAALQPERQADVLLDSASGAQHAIVTNRPEVDLESFISIGENETQKSDISHSEEVKENVGVGVSELASDVTCQTDQQLIDSSSGKKIPEEKLPNVCSVTEEQRDDNTEMFISSTTEITTESIHTAENTANECSLQGTISSPKVEMPAEVEQNEYLHLSEVAQAHLEDAVNKGHENEIKLMGMHEIAYSSESVVHDGKSDNDHVYDTRKPQSSDIERDDPALRQVFEVEGTVEEQDVEPNEGQDNLPKVTAGDHSEAAVNKLQPTENQEKPQIDFSPENVTHDAIDKSEIISGKTMDQTEVSDTYQYEMKVTNALDSPINRDNSNSDNTQEEHPKKENIFETSDQRNEDYDVCDIKKTQISDTDRVDTFHVFEGDTNPSDEQTGYQENEELLEERISSLQTLQSEINVPFYPQLQQNANSFQSTGHRRKMGFSRKSKRRPHVKDSGAESDQEPTVDVVGNTRDNETQEGTEMALEIKTDVQEKSMETLLKETDTFDLTQTEGVSEEVKGNAQDDTLVGIADLNSLGLQSSLTTAHLEIDQSNVRDDPDEEPPNLCSVTEKENEEGAEDTEPFRPDGSLPDKYLLREDMKSSFPPEKTTEELSSREPTEPECSVQQDSLSPQKEEVHTNEGQDDNANLPKVTGDVNSKLMDQTEVSDTYLYKLAVTNTDGSPISLEESGSSLQTLQSEINVPSDPQLLQKDSSFHSIGHRRKMGSSRKSKGRPHVKDSGAESDQEPTVDVVGNTRDNETQEGTEMALEIKTEVQEKSMETLLKETDTFDLTQTEGVSEEVKGNAQDDTLVGIADLNSLGLQSSLTTAHLEIDQSNVRDDPDEEPPNLCSVTEKENEEGAEDTERFRPDGSLPDKYLLREDMKSSFPPEKTTEELSSREPTEPECSVQQDSLSPQKEEVHTNEGQDDNSNLPKVTGDVNSKLMDQTEVSDTYLYKLAVTNTDGSPISLEESGSSLQTLQSEINVPSDPQLLQKDSSFHSIGHRRKMGSSRKSKGRPHVKDSGAESDQEPTVDVVGNTRDNETQEGTEMALEIKTEVQEKSMETLLKETDTFDLTQTEGVSEEVKGNAQDDTLVGIADLNSLGLQSSLTTAHLEIDQSNVRDDPDEEPPNLCSVTEKENEEGAEDTERFRPDGSLPDKYLLREDMESSFPPEKTTEELSSREPTEPECSVQQDSLSPQKEEVHTNEGQDDNSNLPKVTGDVNSKLMDQTEVSDTYLYKLAVTNTDGSPISLEESGSSLQTLQSEINVPSDPQLLQKDSSFHSIGHRRKMGSSRKSKGRPHVKDSGAESDQEPTVDVVGNTRDNETQEGTEMALEIKTEVQEKSMETLLKETDTFDLTQTEGVSEEVKGNAQDDTLVGIADLNSLGLQSSLTTAHLEIDQSNVRDDPDEEPPNLCSVTEKENEEGAEDTERFRPDGSLPDKYLLREDMESSFPPEKTTEELSSREPTEPECSVQQDSLSPQKEEVHTNEGQDDNSNLPKVTGDVNSKLMDQTEVSDTYLYKLAVTNTDGSPISLEESGSSLQTLQSEINVPSDPQLLQKDSSFHSIGHRRKMGSSRKSKGRPHVKDSGAESDQEPTVDVVGNTRDNETQEGTEMALEIKTEVQEKSMETLLKETDTFDLTQTEGVSEEVKGNAQDDTLVGIADLNSLGLQSSLTTAHLEIDQSNVRDDPDEEPPNLCSVTEKENEEGAEDTEPFRPDGSLPDKYLLREDMESSFPPEKTTEELSSREPTEPECCVQQDSLSPQKEEVHTNEGQDDNSNLPKVTGDVNSKLMDQTEVSDTYLYKLAVTNTDGSPISLEESGSSLQTLQSEINVPSDPQLLQKDSSFHSIGHRRKMGSSRKSKGRPHVKDSGAESDQEPTVDVVGNTRDNETQEGTEMALEIKTEVQEKSMETLLKETDTFDLTQTEGVSEEVKGNAQDDTLVGIADLNSLGLQSSLTTAHLEIDQSNVRDDPDEEPPNLCSVTEKENEEGAEDTEPFRPDGSLPDKYLLREDMESSFPPEKTTEELSSREPTEPECSVQQDSLSPQKEEVHTNEGQDDNSNLPKVTGDVNSKLMDQTEVSDTYLYKLAVTNTDGSPISLEESGSSLQTLQSEINVPSDPQLLQKDSSFHSIGHRRKMGSSRKSKGRPHVKDSGAESDQEPTVDVVGNTRDNETQEGTEMALEIKTEVQEKSMETLLKETDTFDLTQTEGVSEEVKGNAQDDTLVGIADLNSLGLQSSLTTAHLEIDQSNVRDDPDEEPPNLCSVTEKENEEGAEDTEPFRPDGSLPDKYLLREDMKSSFPPEKTTEELSSREPTEPECSVQQDSLSPQKEEVHTNEGQDDNSNLPKVTGDVNSKLMDQTEVSDTYLYKLAVTNTDGSPISLEESGSSLQTLQSEINVPSDPQLLQKDSSFHSIGHRRKMGSSRKSKGRPHVKDSGAESDQEPTVDVVGNTRDNETQEGTEMALEIKTEVQEKSMETLLKETDTFDLTQTEGVSEEVKGNAQDDTLVGIADLNSLGLQSSLTTAHLEIDQSNVRDDPDEEPPNLCSVTEKENEEGAEDTEPFRPDGSLPDKYLLREDMESSFPPEKTTEELSSREPTEPECSVQQDSLSPQKEEVHTNEGQDDNSNLPKVTGDVNSKLMDQTEVSDTYLYKLAVTNTDGSPISLEESGSSLQTLQSEINVPSDPQLLQKDSSFHSIGHRRKMGSSRKSKGRPHVKDSGAESDQEPTVDVVGNTRDNETQEGTEMALEIKTEVQEKSMETLLKETDTFDLTQTEGVSEEVKGNAQDDTLVGIADLNSLGLQSSLTTAHLEIDQSNVRDDPDEEPPNLCSVTEKENEEGAEDTEPFRPDGSLPDKYLLREDMESSFPPEKTTEELSSREPTEPECSVQQDSLSPQKEEVHTNEGQDDNSNLPKVTGDVNSKLMDQTEVSDTYLYKLAVTNTDGSPISLEESGSSLQTLQSEINVPSDPQLLQKDSSFHSIGHRRKMGSSRKSKGRPYVKDSGAESDQEPTVDVVGNTRDNETQEGTEMAIEIKTEVQEKSMETLLKETDTFDLTQTEGVSEEVKGNAQDDALVGIPDLNSLGLQSSLTTAHLEIDQSNVRDDPVYLYKLAVTNTDGSPISVEESGLSLQTLQSEINVPSDPQHLQKASSFHSIGHRRKMGSSRRNKVRPHVKDSGAESDQEPTVDVVGNTRDYETHEETEMALKKDLEVQERSMETFLKETDTFDMTQTEGVSDQVKGNAQDDNRVSIDLTSSSSAVDRQIVEHSNFRQTSDKELPKVCCVTEKDNRESSVALEISTERRPEEHNETECTVEQAEFSPLEDKLSINEGQKQPVTGTWHSHKSINQTKKEHESQETNVSKEIPKVELFSAPPTLDPCDFGLKQAETTVDVSEQSGTSSLQGMQEPNNSDDIVILHGRSTQKRRKMGSTRQTQFSGKRREKRAQTQESDPEADTGNLDRMEKVEELTTISTAEVSQSENAKLPPSVVYKEQQETNEARAEEKKLIGLFKDTSKALPPEQSASLSEEVVDPVEFVAADAKHHKGNAAVSGEPSHYTSPTEVLNTTNPRLSSSKDTPNYSMTGAASVTACEPTKSTRNDEERVENVDITKDIALISTEACVVADLETVKSGTERGAAEEHITTQAMELEPDNAEEAAPSRDPDMENAGPCLDAKNRRRKMGSTRRNLRTGSKQEDSHQTQDVSDRVTETVTNVADVRIESSSSKKDELQVDAADKDGGTETTESSHTSESHKPPPHRTFEENPVSQGRMLETEHQAAPSYLSAEPSTPAKDGLIAESAFGGRRRKMGSNRKSHQSHETQTARVDKMKDTQNERDVRSIREENPIETEELREESSKVDQSHKKQLANLSSSKEGDDATPVSEKTPEPVTAAQQYAGFQSQMFSLEERSDLRSKAYNVMMVGDSSVGKSSFMKRAQSGKFSLDLPASVGLDYCMWTVLVEGKPVVLQLWDTAGQERFHSITKQTFHKAHAFLLMYDITCSQSFFAVSYWERCIREAAAEGVTIILVGNKSDGAERQVKSQEADILAAEYKFEFMECSAATGENVVQCLETVARMLSQKDETREDNMVLRKEPQQKTKSRCC